MNICIVSCVFPPEPVVSAKISFALAEYFQKTDSVDVICPYPSRPIGFEFDLKEGALNDSSFNYTIKRTNSLIYPKANPVGRLMESISFGIATFRHIRKNKSKYSIVYANTWPIFGQLGVALACKRFKIPYVIHIQDIYPESLCNKLPFPFSYFFKTGLLPIEKYNLRNAARIVVISNYMKEQILLRGKINEKVIFQVNNWQENNSGLGNSRDVNSVFTFMYLGNNGPVSNIAYVIKVFFDSGINAELIIAGAGSKKIECQKLVSELGVQNIKFCDVPSGHVGIVQAKADVLLLPTIKNGAISSIPSKLPAYMFSKKPILAIVDKGTDTYDAIVESCCGWVVEPDDVGSLTNTFKSIPNISGDQLKQMGERGYAYASANFSKEVNIKKLVSIIQQVV